MSYSPALFDYGMFDYSFFDITNEIYLMSRWMVDEVIDTDKLGHAENVTFTRVAKTNDSMGRESAAVETSDTNVRVFLNSTTDEDRQLIDKGESVQGYLIGYVKIAYELTNNGTIRFEVGDIITRTADSDPTASLVSRRWRAEKIQKKCYICGAESFRKILFRLMEA